MKESHFLCASCASELVDHAFDRPCPVCHNPTVLDERYVLLDAVGLGDVGVTCRARQIEDGKIVAIKELSMRRMGSFKKQELFSREADTLRQLDHHGIPTLHDEFVWGVGKHQAYYLVQEFIHGKTLAEEFAHRRYSEREVFEVLRELLDILTYLHSRAPAVIHRDIKPENIMRRETGELVLVDFGAVGEESFLGNGKTIAGTFGYMAPEQLRGSASRASDLYALGVLGVVMLTRVQPCEMMDRSGRLRWRARIDRVASVPATVILETLLDPDPSRRARDARACARQIDALLAGDIQAPIMRVEPRAVAARQPERESLFGLGVVAVCAVALALPCAVVAVGWVHVLVVLSWMLLVALLVTPFLPRDEEPAPEQLTSEVQD